MKCGHLFNGIGGFALAAQCMGWENVMHCEIDTFCNKVMNYHFPNSIQHEDIRNTTFTVYQGKLGLLTGGFPCQPYSTAGKRKGKDDNRHLWPEMLRAIREIRPRWVVGENVRGLISWNGGLVFDEVQSDLEAEGYEVLPFLLPSAGVNAPHRRDRIWFVAYSTMLRCGRHISSGKAIQWTEQTCRETWPGNNKDGAFTNSGCISCDGREGIEPGQCEYNGENTGGEEKTNQPERLWTQGSVADSKSSKTQGNWPDWIKKPRLQIEAVLPGCDVSRDHWKEWPTQSPLCSGNDGLSSRLDGITFSKWRRESIKAGGNAIVPQVVLQIFKAIDKYEKYGIH